MPERLRRLEYAFQRLPIYFVTSCTHDRRSILNNSAIHGRLIEFGMNLSRWIKSLKNSLSKTLRIQNIPAPHWQKGFFDHILRSGESYSAKWDYVRENPVRAGFVKEWNEWPFIGKIFDLEFRDDRV